MDVDYQQSEWDVPNSGDRYVVGCQTELTVSLCRLFS